MNEKPASKKYKFLYLVLAGFLGTLAFYVAAYVDMAVTGVPLDITVVLGQLIAGEHESAQIVGRNGSRDPHRRDPQPPGLRGLAGQ